MRRLVAIFAAVAAMSLAGTSAAAGGKSFSTDLSGEAEVTVTGVPNQGDLDGSGQARIVINRGKKSQVCWSINVTGISLPASAAHIHVAPATTAGPVVVTLTPPGTDGMSSGCVSVDRALARAIAGNPADYYVNVHNADYPAGALRGQLG